MKGVINIHNIFTRTYDFDVEKREVQEFWDNKAKYDDYEEGCSGLNSPIEWRDRTVFESYDKADEWIEKNDFSYWQIAVPYISNDVLKHSKEYKSISAKLAKLKQKKSLLDDKVHYSSRNVKSEFVACKNCKSRLATRYIKTNTCPLCGKDLRPDNIVKKINDYSKSIQKLSYDLRQQDFKDERAGKKTKGKKWLVKVEYHT